MATPNGNSKASQQPPESRGLHRLKISERPPKTWSQTLNALGYTVIFNLGCIMVNGAQFIFLLPLYFLPWTRGIYDSGIRYSKGAFGILLVLVCQWFAPTSLLVTFEREGPGAFTDEEAEGLVMRNRKGRVVGLNLPQKSVLIANHQMYADWMYVWCLTYFAGTHRDVYIVLKKSLKWIPVVGWGMQFFNFIFLARSWASDRHYLVKELASIGRHAEQTDTPLAFILYPEGTLVSKDTRPISKKYADKIGMPDMQYTLLPRSTGLHYSLRALSPRIPSLQLIDITVAYPGIPAFDYGQSYYTLRSIFLDRIPPPAVHMHIRRFDVAKDVPIGDVSKTNPAALGTSHDLTKQTTLEAEIPEDEREKFDVWVRELWVEKDKVMGRYLETGTMSLSVEKQPEVVIPLKLRHRREILEAFMFFVPALAGYVWALLRKLTP